MKVFVSPSQPDHKVGFCQTMAGELLLPVECDCPDEMCDATIFVGAETGRSSSIAEVAERADLTPESHAQELLPIFLEMEEDGRSDRELAKAMWQYLALIVLGAMAFEKGAVVQGRGPAQFELVSGNVDRQGARELEEMSGLRLIHGADVN